MTAEIGVMNTLCVALASDSAITLGGKDGKIFTSADKLFRLSVEAPIGAMIYGNSSLVDIPWETIIKTYRKQLRRNTFDTVEKYAIDFVKFLKMRRDMFSLSSQRENSEYLISTCFAAIRDDIWTKLKEKEKRKSKILENEIKNVVLVVVNEHLKMVRQWEIPSGLTNNIRQILRKSLIRKIRSLKKEYFQNLPMKPETGRGFVTIALEVLSRCWLDSYDSGIVIAGFGENEYTPGLVEIKIDGMVEGRLKYSFGEIKRIDDKITSRILPFAQRDMVCTFMEGIEPNLQNMIYNSTASLFSGAVNSIIDKVKNKDAKFGKKLEKEVNIAVNNLIEDLFKKWNQEKRKTHWGPITNIVSSLPKDELAAMAESLVNLTKFRRRVTTEKETVAGPIDVAVITKGDGFVWVKRKHYFQPELNPRKMAHFLREVAYNDKT